MPLSALIQQWLSDNSQNYADPSIVIAHVSASLERIPTLRPKSDIYTYDDGRSQLLLCLHGLLPITYRGATYNIPVAIWLPLAYPRQVPIAYVVPTSDMLVKAGKYVQLSGRTEVEYLKLWERKHEGCNLLALIEAMQEHFSSQPPLYAKPKAGQPSRPSSEYSNRPAPPTPPSQPRSPPILPPKPNSPPNPSPSPFRDLAARPPPPLPRPAPPPTYGPPPNYQPAHSRSSSIPVPPPPLPPTIQPQHPLPPTTAYVSSPPPVIQPPAPPKPAIPNLLDDNESTSVPATSSSTPPPIPPNPVLLSLHQTVHARIQASLQTLTASHQQTAQILSAQQADLLTGEPAIRDEMARLEAVGEVCRSVASRMKAVVAEGERKVAEFQRRMGPDGQGPSVDELVCGTSIVHNQLIDLVAEDNAIEDTIYHLHRALSSGRIDLERFLRTTRVLAEEQFMKRALIERIRTSFSL